MILNPEEFMRAVRRRRVEAFERSTAPSKTQCMPCRGAEPRIRLLGALRDVVTASRMRLT